MEIGRCWKSQPDEWQPLFAEWHATHPNTTALHEWEQFGGQSVVGLTLNPDPSRPFRLLVTVPHGHEPAPTAAIVDAAAQLLTGAHLDGTEADLRADEILENALVTFLPDTNSQGRARSPERCWDGRKHDNDTFLKFAFGIAADRERFGRYPEWRYSEHHPRQVGLVYEKIAPDLYVEPNTSRNSTHSRAIDALFERYAYTHMLDMHQHEGDEVALLPSEYDDLDDSERAALEAWGFRLIEAWTAAGTTPRRRPAVSYRGQPRGELFKAFWKGRCPGMLRLLSEVRNNRHVKTDTPTPMAHQFTMAAAALGTTLTLPLD